MAARGGTPGDDRRAARLARVGAGRFCRCLALPLALANIAGSLLGTKLALKHGAGFVRGMFIAVVIALIAKTGYDAFLR